MDHGDKPLTRADLQNLRATLEAKRLQDVQISQFVVEIVSEVLAVAAGPERKRHYMRQDWKLINMTKEVKEGILHGLKQKFPDTKICFPPMESEMRHSSTSYSLHPTLLVDWS
jgi:hypothetical protein